MEAEVKATPQSQSSNGNRTDNNTDSSHTTTNKVVEKFVRKKNFYSKKECFFTKNRVHYIDYKNIDILGRFISKNGSILPSRVTGVKIIHQRKLAKAIKRARYMGLIPFIGEFNRNNY